MMPFLYATRPTAFPIFVIANQTHDDEDEDEEEEDDTDIDDDYLPLPSAIFSRSIPIPMTSLSPFINIDGQIPPSSQTFNHDDEDTFRLRMNVDGFQPNELNISIRHGRLIVRGKHIVRAQTQPLTTNSIINENDDTEPDFVAKEFKRTFNIPSNADVRKAHAQFYPQQQLLVIEIPFENSTITSSQIINNRIRVRPIDVFLTIITILLMDRALRITYEQFMINEQRTNTSSQYRNRRQRENFDIFF